MTETPIETPPETPEPVEEPVETEVPEPIIPFEEPETEAEQPAPPTEGHGRTPEELEQIRKKLDTSANTWRRRVEDLLGEDFAALTVCELCGEDIPGFHWPPEVQQATSDVQERLLKVLREPARPEYRDATNVRQCPDCGGWGKVLSGSRLASHETVTCPACKGYGYVPPPVPSGNGYVEAAHIDVAPGTPDEPLVADDSDIWGSPRLLPDGQENPNYGKMPQYKIPTLP